MVWISTLSHTRDGFSIGRGPRAPGSPERCQCSVIHYLIVSSSSTAPTRAACQVVPVDDAATGSSSTLSRTRLLQRRCCFHVTRCNVRQVARTLSSPLQHLRYLKGQQQQLTTTAVTGTQNTLLVHRSGSTADYAMVQTGCAATAVTRKRAHRLTLPAPAAGESPAAEVLGTVAFRRPLNARVIQDSLQNIYQRNCRSTTTQQQQHKTSRATTAVTEIYRTRTGPLPAPGWAVMFRWRLSAVQHFRRPPDA
jgi:hypothetical protein